MMDKNSEILSRILELPKIDLHCHLEGSLSPVLAYKNIRAKNLSLSDGREAGSFEQFLDLVSIEEQARDILDFTGPYFRFLNGCLTSCDDIREFSFDLVRRASEDNVKLLEVSVFPGYLAGSIRRNTGVRHPAEKILQAVSQGLREAEEQYETVTAIIVCFGAYSLKSAAYVERVIEISRELASCPLQCVPIEGADIGDFDLDYFGLDPIVEQQIRENIESLKKAGLGLKCHAGEALIELEGEDEVAVAMETGLPESIRRGLDYGVTRIGHGLGLAKDRALLQEVKKRGVNIELCPVSNYKTNVFKDFERDYPIRKFLDQGLSLSINSDDTTIQRSTWKDDWLWAHIRFGVNMDQLRSILSSAFASSFISPDRKERVAHLF